MKIGAQDKPNPSSYLELVYAHVRACAHMRAHARAQALMFYVFTVSFITRSIFGLFELFLSLTLRENANKEKVYNHIIRLARAIVFPFKEMSRFRSIVGSLNWLAINALPEISFRVMILSMQ